MSETRLEKYRKYRESLNEVKANTKTDAANEMRKANVVTEKFNTTSTLPLDEVIGQISEENETVSNKIITRKRVQIIIVIAVGVVLLAVLGVFAYFAFRG